MNETWTDRYVVAVTGGRTFRDISVVRDALTRLPFPPTLLIHGGCTGADELAARAAVEMGIPVRCFPANWGLGKKAGPIRNRQMIEFGPDVVLAFPGGKGTASMRRMAEKAEIEVIEVRP